MRVPSLIGNMERRLREETGGIIGHVIPTPSAKPIDDFADLKNDLKVITGNFALVPSMTDGGSSDPCRGNAPDSDWGVQASVSQRLRRACAAVRRAGLTDKLNVRISLDFYSMFASNLSGRAQVFQPMVGGGKEY